MCFFGVSRNLAGTLDKSIPLKILPRLKQVKCWTTATSFVFVRIVDSNLIYMIQQPEETQSKVMNST